MRDLETFVGYRHTGENPEYLAAMLGTARDALARAGVNAYCTFFDEADFQDKSLGAREIMEHAFSKIDVSDMLFIVQHSENKSEGMLMEVGYAIAKNIPVVVAVQASVEHTYLPDMATTTLRWNDLEDLQQQIEATDFSTLVSRQDKLIEFVLDEQAIPVRFNGTIVVKEGVECDTYSFEGDSDKDLAIVRVEKGHKTPLQRVVGGIRTIEGYVDGEGTLTIRSENGQSELRHFGPGLYNKEVAVGVGQTMQWTAGEDKGLTFYEICVPPYEDGRYENLPE